MTTPIVVTPEVVKSTKNEYEYRSLLLDALNVEHTVSDVKDTETYRAKLLTGLSQEYTQDDIKQTDLFRDKVVTGLTDLASGGGGDVATATVTFNMTNYATDYMGDVSVVSKNHKKGAFYHPTIGITDYFSINSESASALVILDPDDYCYLEFGNGSETSVTGDARINNGQIIVTGDCTVNFTGIDFGGGES